MSMRIVCALYIDRACMYLYVFKFRTGTPTRRRTGAADLTAIRELKSVLTIPVLSNGNVRRAADIVVAEVKQM